MEVGTQHWLLFAPVLLGCVVVAIGTLSGRMNRFLFWGPCLLPFSVAFAPYGWGHEFIFSLPMCVLFGAYGAMMFTRGRRWLGMAMASYCLMTTVCHAVLISVALPFSFQTLALVGLFQCMMPVMLWSPSLRRLAATNPVA